MGEDGTLQADVRAAVVSDATAIVQIIRSRFDAQFGSFYIHACEGAERFVRHQILATSLHGDSSYTVAADGASVVGCIELKRSGSAVCVNYVAVLETHAARGLGSQLLRHALARSDASSIFLDVLSTNNPALGWYRRLGFREVAETTWLAAPLPPVREGETFYVSGLPQAHACLAEYGFGEFRIETPNRPYTVGMLGREWFSTPAKALTDPAVAQALRTLDSNRKLLLRVPDVAEVAPFVADLCELVRTRRMSAATSEVRAALNVH